MKKYFLLTAISSALLLTACGNTQNDTAETSAYTTAATTLNSVTEMTVPAFEPEWEETAESSVFEQEEAVVTSPAYDPSEDEPAVTTSVPIETVEVVSETTSAVTEEITTSEEEESVIFEAYVYGVEENAILVGMKGDTFIGEDGTDVYIFGKYDVEQGDIVNIVFTDEVEIDESYPPEISEQFIVSLEKIEYAQGYDLPYDSGDYDIPDVELAENQHVAYVTAVCEVNSGGYSLTVEAYNVAGYGLYVPISLYSESEFAVGDWVKVEFAPETCFMETSPLQVNKSDILSIELIDY